MMQRDLDMDIYFPLTLAREVFGDIDRQAPGRRDGAQADRADRDLAAGRRTSRTSSDSPRSRRTSSASPDARARGRRVDVEVKAPIQILRNAERTQRMFNFIMVGIASLSLVVGGIGIMNIMLATVTERTREIGIRRALGAKRRHITLQFLIETTVICLTGGLIGIAIGAGVRRSPCPASSSTSARRPALPDRHRDWSVVGSFVVSGLIGIGFGLYPAIMAARMNPIEALRHE